MAWIGPTISGLAERSSLTGVFLCIMCAMFGIWQLMIRQRPKMRELEISEEAAQAAREAVLRSERRGDITDLWNRIEKMQGEHDAEIRALRAEHALEIQSQHRRIERLEASLKAETVQRVDAQMQISYLVAGLGMVSSELERLDPGNLVIRQARAMVGKATKKDKLSGDLIEALDMDPDATIDGGTP